MEGIRLKVKRNYLKISLFYLVAVVYSFLHWSGFYGFGHDFYAFYHQIGAGYGGLFDSLGFYVSTYGVDGIHLGVLLSSILLSISLFFMMMEFFSDKGFLNNWFLFFVSFILLLHFWPVFMSVSNAMRQGIGMSFIFFALGSYFRRNYLFALVFVIFSIFSHKSMILFGALFLFCFILRWFSLSVFLVLSAGLAVTLYYLVGVFIEQTRIIGLDVSIGLALVSAVVVLLSLHKMLVLKANNLHWLDRWVFVCNLALFSIFLSGVSWQFERFAMVVLIPNIFYLIRPVSPWLGSFCLLLSSLSGVALTFLAGMYGSFV